MARHLLSFRDDRRGGVAIIFGLAILGIAGSAGAAVDYSRSLDLRASMQVAADAAALAAASGSKPFTERRAQGLATLDGQLRSLDGVTYERDIEQVLEKGKEAAVRVTVSASVPTTIVRVIGVDAVDVSVEAQATSGRDELLDVAFVLDTTDSMEGDRIAALKEGAVRLIDELRAYRADLDQVEVSVIPFGQYVNVGMGNRNQPWLDVPSDFQTPEQSKCWWQKEIVRQECKTVRRPAKPFRARTCDRDGVPYDCSEPAQPAYDDKDCENVEGEKQVEVCSRWGGEWKRWEGCVGSRPDGLELRDDSYATPIPGLLDVSCGSPILEPTNALEQAKNRIADLRLSGQTYIPSGLIWGWRALSPGAPLEAREDEPGAPVQRHMILVTDGKNTRSVDEDRPAYHDGTDTEDANAVMEDTCANIAADTEIRIHTIAFGVDDLEVKTILENCSALTGGTYFDAGNGEDLELALLGIGERIGNVRLSH